MTYYYREGISTNDDKTTRILKDNYSESNYDPKKL